MSDTVSTPHTSNEAAAGDVLKPGELIRPQISLATAQSLAEKLYGFKVASIKELNSYDDKNYRIEAVKDSCSNANIEALNENGYTLKILNKMDTPKQHVEAEHQMLRRLKESNIDCLQPVLNLVGNDFSREVLFVESGKETGSEESQSAVHLVRLMTFMPGRILHSVPYTPAILYECGELMGRVNKALEGYSHPVLTSMKTIWSLKCLPDLRKFTYAVTDENHKKMVNEVIEAFETEIEPNYHKFRKAIIHGDFNEQNILVNERPSDKQTADDKYTVGSVIDFGDAQEAYYVMDVAIAIMYLMVDNTFMDPLDVGGHVISGYRKSIELSEDEFNSLRVLVAGRFCQSLVMGAYSYMQDPGNTYLLITAERGWTVLTSLWQTSSQDLYTRWRKVYH